MNKPMTLRRMKTDWGSKSLFLPTLLAASLTKCLLVLLLSLQVCRAEPSGKSG